MKKIFLLTIVFALVALFNVNAQNDYIVRDITFAAGDSTSGYVNGKAYKPGCLVFTDELDSLTATQVVIYHSSDTTAASFMLYNYNNAPVAINIIDGNTNCFVFDELKGLLRYFKFALRDAAHASVAVVGQQSIGWIRVVN